MKCWTRREIGRLAAGACLAAAAPRVARGQAAARVVVIGGGVGGATAARYLAVSGGIEVTLLEPKASYATCFFSNLYLAGLRSFGSLVHGYTTLADRYGIRVVHDHAVSVDPVAKQVRVGGGTELPYDRLVVAPGIAFDFAAIEGYDEAAAEVLPHAWIAGPQTELLRAQLESMDDGGLFLIVAPPNRFRCPPGPYERASRVAYYFKRYKPRSKVLILDAKDSFFPQDLFQDGWARHYPGMIEWLPAQFTGGIEAVDVPGRTVKTAGSSFEGAVVNVIPPQRAGEIAQQAGLADASGWCPIDPLTFESKLQPGIHVAGDATDAGDMPKSAFVANSQAKACAFAIAAELTGSERAASRLFNTCYTFLSADDAVSDATIFEASAGTVTVRDRFLSAVGDSETMRREAAREAQGWYAAFTHDVFG